MENIIEKNYVSTKSVHLGSIKVTIQRGSVIKYRNVNGKESYEVGGNTVENMSDFNICIKAGLFKLYDGTQNIAVAPQAKVPKADVPKMEVLQSDEDMMTKVIDIKDTKSEQVAEAKRIREQASHKEHLEETGRETRGLKIVKDASRELIKDIKPSTSVKGEEVAESSVNSEVADGFNEGAVVVAKIGKNAEEAAKLLAVSKNTLETPVNAVDVKDKPIQSKPKKATTPKKSVKKNTKLVTKASNSED